MATASRRGRWAPLAELGIDLGEAHMIEGLRMIAGSTERVLPWPETSRFPAHGAVWPRRDLDAALIDAAAEAGAEIIWSTEALPVFDGEQVVGVEARRRKLVRGHGGGGRRGAGKGGQDAGRNPGRRGALRSRHPQLRCFALVMPRGTWRPASPCGTQAAIRFPDTGGYSPQVTARSISGVGALSTMKRFKRLNLNSLLDLYHARGEEIVGGRFLFGAAQSLAPTNEYRPASRSRMGGGGGPRPG